MVQGACVENTLDSVIASLQRDRNRKFVFAEMVILLITEGFWYESILCQMSCWLVLNQVCEAYRLL